MNAGLEVVVDGTIYQIQSHGGISRLFSEILPRMCAMDDSLHITLLTDGKHRQSLPEHKRIIHRAILRAKRYLRPRRVWRPIIPSARRFVRGLCIGRGKGQIWHSTYYTLPEPWDGLQVVTVVDMIHERFPDQINGPVNDQFREQKRRCVQQADAVICISETTRHGVQHYYEVGPESIHVVPLACSDVFRRLEQAHNNSDRSSSEPFLLYVGSRCRYQDSYRTHYKNFSMLVQGYTVWPCREEVALVVVGRLWSATERRHLAELGIQNRVHLLTDVDDEELCRLYDQADAFVYPSLYEGFGIPLLEAMACGCPVVASRIPSTIEVAGMCPVYFESAEVESLLAAFDMALSEGRDSERVRSGFERVKSYSWDKTAKQTLEVYYVLSGRA